MEQTRPFTSFAALPLSCIIGSATEEQKWDRPGSKATYH